MSSLFSKKIITNLRKKIASRGVYKNLFSCLGICLIGLACFFSIKFLSAQELSFLTANSLDKVFSKNLFIEPNKNFIKESPEMSFVQGNSLVRISAPINVSSQALATTIEEQEVLPETGPGLIEYIVEEGDTVSSIANKFDINLDTILWANNLSSSSKITPGQELLILPVSGAIHMVKEGDTLGSIAKKYKGDLEEMIAFNGLSGEGDIYIGDILIIPGGKMPAVPVKVTATPLAESYFMFPCEGNISQGAHGAFGNAIDIANKCGKPIVAAAGGTIQRAGSAPIIGKMVTILHPNGVVTSYGHLSSILVVPGQVVGTGEIIGHIGNTGYTVGATGCHLHFEVRGASNFLARYLLGSTISWK